MIFLIQKDSCIPCHICTIYTPCFWFKPEKRKWYNQSIMPKFLYDNWPSDCQIIIYLITTLFEISYLQTFVLAVFSRSRCSQMLFKVGDLKIFLNFTGKHLRWSLFFIKVGGLQGLQLYEKETPTQVFSCHMWEVFNNTFFYRTLSVAASTSPCSQIS